MRGRFAVLSLALLGCAPLPAVVTPGQIRAVFGGESELVLDAAQRCAERLNGLVRSARASGAARTSVSAAGALLGGIGAAVGGLSEEPTQNNRLATANRTARSPGRSSLQSER